MPLVIDTQGFVGLVQLNNVFDKVSKHKFNMSTYCIQTIISVNNMKVLCDLVRWTLILCELSYLYLCKYLPKIKFNILQAMVRVLLKDANADVNHQLSFTDLVPGRQVKCNPVSYAIVQNTEDDIIKILVEDFGADLNAKIFVDGNKTSIFHLALRLGEIFALKFFSMWPSIPFHLL